MVKTDHVRVLILGGGIHGVGILHDLASRGWHDTLLLEKSTLGTGTSSRSTKLVHGGLRYLQHPRDFGLVREALHERRLLIDLAPDIIHPLEFYFPILKKGGLPGWMVKTGLFLYDTLAGKGNLSPYQDIGPDKLNAEAPFLDNAKFSRVLSFFDGQMDDLALVKRVGASAMALGGNLLEGAKANQLELTDKGWLCHWTAPNGEAKSTRAQYIVNAMGPWSNRLIQDSGLKPTHNAINNKGIHLITKAISGQKVGCFFQSPEDGRIFFLLPWLGSTLIGTTESLYTGNPDQVAADQSEIEYLLERCNRYLKTKIGTKDVTTTFAGLRWLPVKHGSELTTMSRSHVLGMHPSMSGFMLTIYGGKFTTYRSLSANIGDRITRHSGQFQPSQTHLQKAWLKSHESYFSVPGIYDRFSLNSAGGF